MIEFARQRRCLHLCMLSRAGLSPLSLSRPLAYHDQTKNEEPTNLEKALRWLVFTYCEDLLACFVQHYACVCLMFMEVLGERGMQD